MKKEGLNFYAGVPCSILKDIIDCLSNDPKVVYVNTTREDEAIGIATGTHLGGKYPVVLMQNSGLGNSINALTSLVLLYKFPIFFIISWRGYKGKDAPEHLVMGRSVLKFLKILKIPYKILKKDNNEKEILDLIKIMKEKNIPVALILIRGVIE